MKLVTSILIMAFMGSCASFKAERVDDKTSDEKGLKITDNWMREDTRQTIEKLISQMKKHPRYKRMIAKSQGDAKVFIAEVQNKTAEAYFPIDNLNDEFLYKLSELGTFTLVDAAARNKILEEVTYQNDGMVDPNSAKQIGKQIGAEYLIFGSVTMRPEKRDGKTIKEYTVNFRMTNIEKGTEVFRLRHGINKFSDKSSYSWD